MALHLNLELYIPNIPVHIGVTEQERTNQQPIDIRVYIELINSISCESDLIDDTVDYEQLYTTIRKVVKESECKLLESLGYRIIEVINKLWSVRSIKVELFKPEVLPNKVEAKVVVVSN